MTTNGSLCGSDPISDATVSLCFFLIPTEDKRGWAVRPSPTVIDSGIYDLHYFSDGSSNLLSFSSRLLDSFVRPRKEE